MSILIVLALGALLITLFVKFGHLFTTKQQTSNQLEHDDYKDRATRNTWICITELKDALPQDYITTIEGVDFPEIHYTSDSTKWQLWFSQHSTSITAHIAKTDSTHIQYPDTFFIEANSIDPQRFIGDAKYWTLSDRHDYPLTGKTPYVLGIMGNAKKTDQYNTILNIKQPLRLELHPDLLSLALVFQPSHQPFMSSTLRRIIDILSEPHWPTPQTCQEGWMNLLHDREDNDEGALALRYLLTNEHTTPSCKKDAEQQTKQSTHPGIIYERQRVGLSTQPASVDVHLYGAIFGQTLDDRMSALDRFLQDADTLQKPEQLLSIIKRTPPDCMPAVIRAYFECLARTQAHDDDLWQWMVWYKHNNINTLRLTFQSEIRRASVPAFKTLENPHIVDLLVRLRSTTPIHRDLALKLLMDSTTTHLRIQIVGQLVQSTPSTFHPHLATLLGDLSNPKIEDVTNLAELVYAHSSNIELEIALATIVAYTFLDPNYIERIAHCLRHVNPRAHEAALSGLGPFKMLNTEHMAKALMLLEYTTDDANRRKIFDVLSTTLEATQTIWTNTVSTERHLRSSQGTLIATPMETLNPILARLIEALLEPQDEEQEVIFKARLSMLTSCFMNWPGPPCFELFAHVPPVHFPRHKAADFIKWITQQPNPKQWIEKSQHTLLELFLEPFNLESHHIDTLEQWLKLYGGGLLIPRLYEAHNKTKDQRIIDMFNFVKDKYQRAGGISMTQDMGMSGAISLQKETGSLTMSDEPPTPKDL